MLCCQFYSLSLENDDMESSKRCVKLLSLIFIIRCLTKSNLIRKLSQNMTKTEFMLIGSRQKLNSLSAIPALEINGTQLNRVNFTKSLGVLMKI